MTQIVEKAIIAKIADIPAKKIVAMAKFVEVANLAKMAKISKLDKKTKLAKIAKLAKKFQNALKARRHQIG